MAQGLGCFRGFWVWVPIKHLFPYGRFPKLGGPNNKDCSILGFILGSPILGNYLICVPWKTGLRVLDF